MDRKYPIGHSISCILSSQNYQFALSKSISTKYREKFSGMECEDLPYPPSSNFHSFNFPLTQIPDPHWNHFHPQKRIFTLTERVDGVLQYSPAAVASMLEFPHWQVSTGVNYGRMVAGQRVVAELEWKDTFCLVPHIFMIR